MRLFGAVFNDRHAAAQHGREHDIHRCTDGDDIQIHMSALQTALRRVRADIAAELLDACAHCLKALDVLVDGADAEVAAAGHCHARVTESAELGSDEIV